MRTLLVCFEKSDRQQKYNKFKRKTDLQNSSTLHTAIKYDITFNKNINSKNERKIIVRK